MASLLLAAGEAGQRRSLPNTRIMLHQPSGGASVRSCSGRVLRHNFCIFRSGPWRSIKRAVETGCPGQSVFLATLSVDEMALGSATWRSLLNNVAWCVQGQASDIVIHAQEIEKLRSRLNQLYLSHCAQPLDVIGMMHSTILFC